MTGEKVIVVDMDSTLLRLNLNRPELRQRIRDEFLKVGVDRNFIPLFKQVEAACAELAERNQEAAQRLRAHAWQLIDAAELKRATTATRCDGVESFLERCAGIPLALYSNNSRAAVVKALQHTDIGTERFFSIQAREAAASLKPAAEPLLKILAACEHPPKRLFMIGDQPYDIRAATSTQRSIEKTAARDERCKVVSIGLRSTHENDRAMEKEGAAYLAVDLNEAADFVLTEPIQSSLSIVLLAYNEAATIAEAISETRAFCQHYVPNYEIIVVDDGSSDATTAIAQKHHQGDLKLLRHQQNLGMGAAMRTGYNAATKEHVVHLPADRQIRAQSLITALPRIQPKKVIVIDYNKPPSGLKRQWLSYGFRFCLRLFGGFKVKLDGVYIFPRERYARINPERIAANTFVLPFEMLQEFYCQGLGFERVWITPFMRAFGSSRVANINRIVRIFIEILKSRWRRLRYPLVAN